MQPDDQTPPDPAPTHPAWLRTVAILSIAAICGWFIMEMEILGSRMLAPNFGSAVYVVMGSVIGVFLLSLSVGYMLGGWLSTHPRSKQALGLSILVAGLWVAALPLLVDPVSEAIFGLTPDVRLGSLAASFVLFAVPTVLLGTVSPTVVRWLTTDASDSGFNAGLVFALSTVASFGGCIATAFYLVLLSLNKTLWVSGGMLVLLGAVILVHGTVIGRRSVAPPAETEPLEEHTS